MPEVLHYRGDHRAFDPDLVLGPDRDGRRMRIVRSTYDEATDVTIAVLRAVMPAEFRERLEAKRPMYQSYNRIRELFAHG